MKCIAALAIFLFTGCTQNHEPVIDASNLQGPITAKLENIGDFANGSPWTLELDADGTANLIIWGYPSNVFRTFPVSNDRIEKLRSLLAEQRFFDLDDEYGERVPGGSTQTLTVTCGGHTHTVQLHFLMNWVHGETWRLREPARAVRVWRHIRTWFDDKDAVDLKRYDDMVLDAAPS